MFLFSLLLDFILLPNEGHWCLPDWDSCLLASIISMHLYCFSIVHISGQSDLILIDRYANNISCILICYLYANTTSYSAECIMDLLVISSMSLSFKLGKSFAMFELEWALLIDTEVSGMWAIDWYPPRHPQPRTPIRH